MRARSINSRPTGRRALSTMNPELDRKLLGGGARRELAQGRWETDWPAPLTVSDGGECSCNEGCAADWSLLARSGAEAVTRGKCCCSGSNESDRVADRVAAPTGLWVLHGTDTRLIRKLRGDRRPPDGHGTHAKGGDDAEGDPRGGSMTDPDASDVQGAGTNESNPANGADGEGEHNPITSQAAVLEGGVLIGLDILWITSEEKDDEGGGGGSGGSVDPAPDPTPEVPVPGYVPITPTPGKIPKAIDRPGSADPCLQQTTGVRYAPLIATLQTDSSLITIKFHFPRADSTRDTGYIGDSTTGDCEDSSIYAVECKGKTHYCCVSKEGSLSCFAYNADCVLLGDGGWPGQCDRPGLPTGFE